jgi:hypothetical protein
MFCRHLLERRLFQDLKEDDMSLINDYPVQILTDQRERDLADLAFRDPHARRALNREGTWWHRLLSRRERMPVTTERGVQTGMTTPAQHRVSQ